MRSCNRSLIKTLELVDDMIRLADEGDANREDSACGILFGVMRDAAFTLKRMAEEEKTAHEKKGWWNEEKEEYRSKEDRR